ncbi:FAD binding domain-containing protein [Rhodococcus sp. BP-252]|uniref:FAD binding domain-containing protein n=1 Tax=unclassified Rhodococcus (in: high G+C Gram-positive bacteria) TaxID=192944 RepID=UPI001C9B2010|nr:MULTISPECIES: FAD binding domain-containing protein [unclassified Rhodococcus (in: high G+C Gram-positive bacteria)]MBY6413819.1 FAD binding domain-containing protein [Rhodococcus sp. BP-320]MBY6419239.1 FAD binding domain-containing protein [Rhodococcus sp. BP-321]MBY6424110.1 FAD binding domain-containing protein [Rhodococcus sp. BP-324]MBY6428608.1 FAD binding domain-containing protein [Rhodococcus sp. BP-323]MBY6434360.1 FAD binding domain-containing protein [Rhodococcus sp. BP-322]
MDLGTIEDVVIPTDRSGLPPGAPDTAVIAGGTWLMSEKQDHLTRLVDITALGWPALDAGYDEHASDGLEIAATCTIGELAEARFDRDWPATALFSQCATALLASFKIWRVATVGGNICMSLPAGSMISMAVSLDAVATVWSSDGSDYRIPVVDLVTGPHENALNVGDVVRSIHVPRHALEATTAFRKTALSPLGRSAAVVIGRVDRDGQFVLSVTAATVRPHVVRFPTTPSPSELEAALRQSIPDDSWYDDPHGAPDWRRHISILSALDILGELS